MLEKHLADIAMASPDFQAWFAGSIAHEHGTPIVTWRGEHGRSEDLFQTNLGSLSFGSREAACIYALDPNDSRMFPHAPRVTPCFLRITKPVMNDPDDPFMDMGRLIRALGREQAHKIALKHASWIMATGNWEDHYADQWHNDLEGLLRFKPAALDELYLLAHIIMDDPVITTSLALHGYDGAICGGCGENALEPEYRVIHASSALPALCWSNALRPLKTAA